MYSLRKDEKDYPSLLQNIKNAPQKLYVQGNIKCLEMPCITVVGSRNMTEYGREMTEKIVKELVKFGVCIVSGLAIGIDSVAHRTCIENGGKTVAVLGSGLNKVYPKENIGLYLDIIKTGGCVLSEQDPDSEAEKIFFPARNRIVSGLSLGTIVIEATYRSGTSITAKFALEQGRKVFCLPNMVGNKNSCGTINLIKKGAIMISEAKDVLYELKLISKDENYEEALERQKINRINILEQEELKQLSEIEKKIYLHIKENKIVNSEVMSEELRMNMQDVNANLTILELKGLIKNKSGCYYCVKDEFYV